MRLLLNLLEIGKIESGQMPAAHEPVTLAAVAEEVAEEYAAVAEQTGRRLVVTVERSLPPAIGDRALLKRVLINLVVNALRHSGSQEVRVEGMHDADAARLELHVIDHGRGIAWGEIRLTSHPETGTVFTITLPSGSAGWGPAWARSPERREDLL